MKSRAHSDLAKGYANDVISGKILACKWVQLACRRFIDDLARSSGNWPFRFDEDKANRICQFAEMLPHVAGTWASATIKLEAWQCFIFCNLFGWVKKSNGLRRFRRASIYVPRKNAKSTACAILGWWMLTKDGERGAQVLCGATSLEQANFVFQPAQEMGRITPRLIEATGAEVNASAIIVPRTNSVFKPLIGMAKDGGNPHLAIIDEFHEFSSSALVDSMKTGQGARRQSLLLIVSTAGDNLSGPCREDWRACEKMLSGAGGYVDETHFALIYGLDEGDDWTTEDALRKANPNWGVSVLPDTVLPDQQKAIRDVREQGAFKTKHLNMWVSSRYGWLNMETWNQCADPSLKIEDFAGQQCWVGLDLASKIDVLSMVAVFRHNSGYACFARHYMPENTIQLPENQHLQAWVRAGHLIQTEGARTDHTQVERDLRAWSEQYAIQELAFDPREANYFVQQVSSWASFPCIEITQGPALMSEPMKELEAQVTALTLRHTGEPVLTWMASNVIRKEARGGGSVKYYYPTKESNDKKIDGMVALIMALGRAMLHVEAPKFGVFSW